MKRLVLSLLFLPCLFAVSKQARADSVTLTLTQPAQVGPEGAVLTYGATVFAPLTNAGNEYLNGLSYTTLAGPLTVDTSDFDANFPYFLAPGGSYTGDLFTVTATPGSAGTVTLGNVVLLGGATDNSVGTLAQANFSAGVTTAATPEPGTLMLTGSGLLGVWTTLRRRRRAGRQA